MPDVNMIPFEQWRELNKTPEAEQSLPWSRNPLIHPNAELTPPDAPAPPACSNEENSPDG